MSDDEEGEYNTITHTETGRGVKLLYSKSKVRSTSPLRSVAEHQGGKKKAYIFGHDRSTSTRHPRRKIIFPASYLCFNRKALLLGDRLRPTHNP